MYRKEVAIDATILPNQVAVTGVLTGTVCSSNYTQQPYYALIDIASGTSTAFNVLNQTFSTQAIDYVAATQALVIVGNKSNPITGEADAYVVSVNPASGSGEINNFSPLFAVNNFANVSVGIGNNIVLTGAHRELFPWLGSPADQNYSWLVTASSAGQGECTTQEGIASQKYATPIWASNTSGTSFTVVATTLVEIQQTETSANACAIAYRTESGAANSGNALPVKGGIHVYPNPASDHVSIEYTASENDNVEVHIVDMTGKVVLSQKLESTQSSSSVNTSTLEPGSYFSNMIINGVSIQKDKLTILQR